MGNLVPQFHLLSKRQKENEEEALYLYNYKSLSFGGDSSLNHGSEMGEGGVADLVADGK
jgi:hypothetical protein